MKQFFALAISCLTVAAFAQPKMNANGAMPNHAKVGAPVMRFDVNAPMQPVQMSGRMDRAMTLEDAMPAQGNVVTSTATGALYRPSSHVLKYGLFYYEEVNKWGYSYNTPYLASQAYKGTYEKVEGSNWTIGTNNSEVPADYLDAEGNLDMGLAGMGVGGFYTPKIWSKTGSASYFYGSDDPDGGFEYSVNFKGDAETMSLGTYQVYGDMSLYSGYSNTLAYGAREFTSNKGSLIQSDMLVLDYGDLGGGFVLQKIEMPILTHEKDVPYFTDGAVVTIKVVDYDEETQESKEYTSVVGEDDIVTDANGNALLYATFTEVDEDGFETEIEPVLNHYVQVIMTGFRQEGVNWGLRMVWDNSADDETRSGGDFGPSHGYYDQWIDGVQNLDSDGNVALYATDCTEPVLELMGYFNALCEYGTGAKEKTGEAPVEGGYVVSAVQEGKSYNDFDLESSFSYEKIEITEAPEWVTGLEYDDQYFEDYSIIMYFVSAEALPAGVAGRAGDVVLTSNGEVSMTLHIVQGEVVEGIESIQADKQAVKTFNLQGQQADANSGLLIKGNKVVFVKK